MPYRRMMLLSWVLLMQANALTSDNPRRTSPVISTWKPAAHVVSRAACDALQTHARTTSASVYRDGMLIRMRYHCVLQDTAPTRTQALPPH